MKKIFSPVQKGRIALEAVKGAKPISQIASEQEVHPNVIGTWKKVVQENVSQLFTDKRKKENQDNDALINASTRSSASATPSRSG